MKPSEVLKSKILSELYAQMDQASDDMLRYQKKYFEARDESSLLKDEYENTLEAIKELERKGL